MKTTILLFTTIFLIGCDTTLPKDAKTSDATVAPKAGRGPFDAPDSADSPIIISDNSSAFNKTTKTASAINFEKDNHLRVYGPKVLAARVTNYQPTWLELVGVTTIASACPSISPTQNCLTGGLLSWGIQINPTQTSLNWDGANNPERVNISLGTPNPTFSSLPKSGSTPAQLIASTPTSSSITGATLTVVQSDGSTLTQTYSCKSPCTIKLHYQCAASSTVTCGN